MSQHHGQPARHVKCRRCGKPFRCHVSELRRGKGRFCSLACYAEARRAFHAYYDRPEAKELSKAA